MNPLHFLGAFGLIALGLIMLFAPRFYREERLRQTDRDIADRLAHGSDRYFEELRTLQAYREPPRLGRFLGLLAVLLGVSYLAIAITR